MNINVTKEAIKDYQDLHGGACAVVSVQIEVDKDLEPRVQRNLVIHEVIEAFCRSWSHEKVEELVDDIVEALDQL